MEVQRGHSALFQKYAEGLDVVCLLSLKNEYFKSDDSGCHPT
jgi:hypothetical protein